MLRLAAQRCVALARGAAVDLPAHVPSTSAPAPYFRVLLGFSSSANGNDAQRQAMVNKLLYRSKQRGFLELDLLVGLWAEENIPKMDLPTLQHMSVLLDQENPDLFKWLTGQLPAPDNMLKNTAYVALRSHVASQLGSNSPEEARAASGKEWVRGWDDSWRGSAANVAKPAESK